MSRDNEKVRKWESGEETGRAVGLVAPFLGNAEIEMESSPEIRKERERHPPTKEQNSQADGSDLYNQGETKSSRRGVPSGRQGEPKSVLVVSWFSSGCL